MHGLWLQFEPFLTGPNGLLRGLIHSLARSAFTQSYPKSILVPRLAHSERHAIALEGAARGLSDVRAGQTKVCPALSLLSWAP
jgi:hypothetical protein